MRKKILALCLLLAAGFAFSQEAPKNNEIYGVTWFEYDLSGTRYDAGIAGDFTFTKLRVGLNAALADNVKSFFEFDPRNGEFRLAYANWVPVENLTLSAGKYPKVFAQVDGVIYGSRITAVGAKYAIPGTGWAALQMGNDADISFFSGTKLAYPGTSASTSIAPTVKGQEFLKILPAIAFKPDLGDVSLEVGANAELVANNYVLNSTKDGTSLDGYLTVSAYGASVGVEYTNSNVFQDKDEQDRTLYVKLAYKVSPIFTPCAYLVCDNIQKDPADITLNVELPVSLTDNLRFNLLGAYAISGLNSMERAVQGEPKPDEKDWTLGFRIDYSYSAKF
jgi:hypothetical protein